MFVNYVEVVYQEYNIWNIVVERDRERGVMVVGGGGILRAYDKGLSS